MGRITLTGEGYKIIILDSMFNEQVLTIGDNDVYSGIYSAEIVLDEGYTLLRAYMLDGMFQEIDIETPSNFELDSDNIIQIDVFTEYNETPSPPKEISGFNYLYLADKEVLKSFAGERFMLNGVDLGDYIINVLELPFILNSDILGNEILIRLGDNVVTTKAIEIVRDEIVVDLGSIEVPAKYNNSYDFLNTEIVLHLPFATSITLDVNYVIGFIINVKYIIDLYTGDVTINVVSSKINNIIHSESTKIGRDIPFIKKIGGETVNSITSKNGLNNGISSPFIEVVRNTLYEQNNPFNSDVITQTTLNNVSGFISVNNVILNTGATLNEKNGIINLLKSGVYIK